jgi:hypothetical protein
MKKYKIFFFTWLFPGLGHWLLNSKRRAFLYSFVILLTFFSGVAMDGKLYSPVKNDFVSILATIANLGMGIFYFILKIVFGYSGNPAHPLNEYGTVFILSAGLMNYLLILEVEKILKEEEK